VTITSPTPGDTWTAGTDVTVTWTKTPDVSDTGLVAVELRKGGDGPGIVVGFTSLVAPLARPGDGTAGFRLPDWAAEATDYTLTLSLATTPASIRQDSVAPITIVGSSPVQTIELHDFPTGQTWRAGHRQRVNFTATGPDNLINVALRQEAGGAYVSTSALASDGFAVVDLPANMPQGSYYVEVRATRASEGRSRRIYPFDRMTAPLIVGANPEPPFEIIAPDPAVVWGPDGGIPVCWNTTLSEGTVTVRLYDFSTTVYSRGSASADLGDGCLTLDPCPYVGGDGILFTYIVQSPDVGILSGSFPDSYTIVAAVPPPTIELTSLNDGPTFNTGDPVVFTWAHSGFPEGSLAYPFLLLEGDEHIWTTNVSYAQPIDNGQFEWAAYAPLSDVTEYLARVCVVSTGCNLLCDEAAAPMTILPPVDPPLFEVFFGELPEVVHPDDVVSAGYLTSGAEGMEVELLMRRDDVYGGRLGSVPAVDGVGAVSGTVLAWPTSGRFNRFEVRLVDNGAIIARAFSEPFVYASSGPTCGDVMQDLIVDRADWKQMASCMALYPLAHAAGPPDGACAAADFNGDQVIDLLDQRMFQNHFGIGSPLEPPNCAVEP